MKVISHYSETESKQFDGEVVKGVNGRVVIGQKDNALNFCMRIFTIAPEGHTPRHSHAWEHEILVHSGSGQVWQDGKWVDVKAGAVIFVPGNEEHQLRNSSAADFVFACVIPKGAPEL